MMSNEKRLNKKSLFYQPLNGYCYTSDSLILYDFILSCFNSNSNKNEVLEVGSGCGIIGLLLARDLDINLSQIEIQENFHFLNEKNAEVNKIKSKTIHSNFLKYYSHKKYDYIISNPPYYRADDVSPDNHDISICKMSDFLNLSHFFKAVKSFLKDKAYFIFCYKSSSLDLVLEELNKNNLKAEKIKFVHSKINKNSKLVLICARLNSKTQINIEAPLIMQINNNDFSDEMIKIYQKTNTYSIKC